MLMVDVPEAEYIVFEHGSFFYDQENRSIEEKVEKAIKLLISQALDTALTLLLEEYFTFTMIQNVFGSMSGSCGNKQDLLVRTMS